MCSTCTASVIKFACECVCVGGVGGLMGGSVCMAHIQCACVCIHVHVHVLRGEYTYMYMYEIVDLLL